MAVSGQRVSFHGAGGVTLVGDAYGAIDAPPVLLLHGGGQTRHAWGRTAVALGAAGFRGIAVDLRGHGDSDWAPDGDYRLDAYADDLRAMLAALARPTAVVGASLGGLATLIAHDQLPSQADGDLAAAVVLVDIAPRVQPAGVERIISFMTSRPDGFASLEEAADAIAAFAHHRPRPKDLAGLRKNLRLGADGRYHWHWDPRMMTGDRKINARAESDRLERAAAKLRVPTLLVRGRMSDVVSEEDARHFLAVAPHAKYVDVSGAGHMVAGDRNDRFTAAVVEFLAGVTRR